MQRLIVVYNPRSSRYADVKQEVLARVKELNGYLVGKYEVAATNLDDNIAQLSKIIKDGDLVLSAGGDATGIISSNAILKSDKDATLAVLPYGNFNDLSRTLHTKKFEDVFNRQDDASRNFYPLEIYIDGKFFRYATCYVTIGMTAEAVQIYDSPELRAKLKSKFGRKITSYTELIKWYFQNRRNHTFIPPFKLNGIPQDNRISDYAAVNGRSMARVMRGGEDYRDSSYFRHETERLTSFPRLMNLMLHSIFSRVPGSATSGDILEFENPSSVMLQAEGESIKLKDAHRIEIKKGTKCLKVIEN
ncbi:acylglycerol kinase family protein [Candidatus Saccharibacteria bacterium]|nr:acylglycerol kinase family protein [Candidatus Saccharibacteria bacterium]